MATDEGNNEILAATKAAKRHRDAAAKTPEPSSGVNWPVAAAGVAIGSAALTAALLYAKARKK
ncbi:MAG: hypothetical protein ABIS14_11160 [Sphingomonas sp.]